MAQSQATVNITTVKGDSLYNDSLLNLSYDRLSFVDATLQAQVRDSLGNLLLELSPIATVENDGSLTVSFDEDPINIPVGNHQWDLQITFDNGEVHTWVKGNFTVLKEVTYE